MKRAALLLVPLALVASGCLPKARKTAAEMEALVRAGMTEAEIIKLFGNPHSKDDPEERKKLPPGRRNIKVIYYFTSDEKVIYITMRDGRVTETIVATLPKPVVE